MSLLDAVQAARGETTTSAPATGTQIQPQGGTRLLDAVQVARGETTYQAPQPVTQQPSRIQQATTFIKQAAPVVVSELKNLNLKNIGKSVAAGAKLLPGQLQTAKGVIASTWAQQNKTAIEFFGKHKTIEKALLNSPLKTPITALKVAREAPGVKDVVKVGLAETEKRGEEMRDLGSRAMTAEKQKYQASAPESQGLQRILELVGYNLPQMAASLAMSAAAAVATRNPSAATAVGLSTTFGFGASEVYNTAREYGLSDSKALPLAQVGGTLIGLIDFIPLARLLRKSGSAEVVKTGIIKRISNSVVSAGIQGGFESITENAQDIVSNAIRQTYDENQKLFDVKQFTDTTLVTLLTGGLADMTVGGVVSALGENTTDEQAIKEIEKRIDEAFTADKQNRTVEQQQVVDAMTSQEWTPDQALSFVLDNNLNNTEVGKSITKAVVQARSNDKNIKLVASEDTDGLRVELVTPEQPGQTQQAEVTPDQTPVEQSETTVDNAPKSDAAPRETTSVPLESIDTDLIEMVESRVNKKTPKILELEEAYKRGDKLPPIPVFEQNGRYITNKDGFHRLQAQRNLGVENVDVVIEQKTELAPEQKQAQERTIAEMESQRTDKSDTETDVKKTEEVNPLIQEARKYKSAEEFVKNSPEYISWKKRNPAVEFEVDDLRKNVLGEHRIQAKIDELKRNNIPVTDDGFVSLYRGADYKTGNIVHPQAWWTTNKDIAKKYGNELSEIKVNVSDVKSYGKNLSSGFGITYQNPVALVRNKDGVFVAPDKVQLTDIYNQATQESKQKPKTPDEAISELNKYYAEADQEAVGNAWYEVMSEMEIAEAGQRVFNEDGEFVGGISSTFPDFVPEELRIKKLFDSVLQGISDPTNIQYPPNSQPRKQELYDIILMEIDSRAGTDSGELTIKIREAYDRADKAKTRTKTEEGSKKAPSESPGGSEKSEQPKQEPVKSKPVPKKPGFSRFQERLEEQLLDSDGNRYNWDETKRTYDKISLQDDAEKATKLLETDPERALSIARGFEDPKLGDPTLFDIINAVAIKAFDDGDTTLGTQLINKVSLTATRYGQNIVTLRGNWNNNSPQSFMKQVIDGRLESLGKLNLIDVSKRLSGRKVSPKTKATAKIDVEVERLQKKVKTEMKLKQNKIQLAQSIIDSLKCK